ncbi:MAG: hypothetical protein SWY16_10875 [Cyanobacteriota bacterium]|nr:hypothetical protein [Cyanobacteriota bacterium]
MSSYPSRSGVFEWESIESVELPENQWPDTQLVLFRSGFSHPEVFS